MGTRDSGEICTECGATEEPWQHDEFIHGWWIEPGVVLAGEYPGNPDPQVAAAKANLLIDPGIRTFVDLTTLDDPLEPYASHVEHAAARRGLDARRIEHPIPDMRVIDVDGYDPILATINDARERGGAYMHCWGGIGRTSTVAGCLLVDSGLDADQALADIDRRRSVTRKAKRPVSRVRRRRRLTSADTSSAAPSASGEL